MRIVAWNICAGGGRRQAAIAHQIALWQADIVALMEFRATPPSQRLAADLHHLGLTHQLTTADTDQPARNALLLASRYPLTLLPVAVAVADPHRCLLAQVSSACPFALLVMHIPNYVSRRKGPFLASVLALAQGWGLEPGLFIGDTNSGLPDLDEEVPVFTRLEQTWMNAMGGSGWADAFRRLHGETRAYTWYSPNGRNGFRLDQAFVNPALWPAVVSMRYDWGRERGPDDRGYPLSDHAAILLDLDERLIHATR